ncbi:MAG: hypothetical protein H8E44_10070 [Planctomycetes bacterium]|nr:hypothetical protein [Planctomycetota bacterium]
MPKDTTRQERLVGALPWWKLLIKCGLPILVGIYRHDLQRFEKPVDRVYGPI